MITKTHLNESRSLYQSYIEPGSLSNGGGSFATERQVPEDWPKNAPLQQSIAVLNVLRPVGISLGSAAARQLPSSHPFV